MELNQFGGSRTDTLIKFILVFFISLLSFSVGTFVGKQFSDSQNRLAQLEMDYEKTEHQMRETASIPADQINVDPEKALTDADVSKLTEEFVAEDKINEVKMEDFVAEKDASKSDHGRAVASKTTKEPTTAATTTTHETAKTQESATQKKPKDKTAEVANKISEGKTPLEAQAPEKKAEAPTLPKTVAATTIGKFTVQVSSQPSEESAKSESLKLKEKGYSAFYVSGDKAGKTWYRVNIGLFQNQKDAQDYAKKLAEIPEFKGAFVKPIVN